MIHTQPEEKTRPVYTELDKGHLSLVVMVTGVIFYYVDTQS